MIDQHLLQEFKGLASYVKYQHEMMEWIRWFGLSTKNSFAINYVDRCLETKIEMYATMVFI